MTTIILVLSAIVTGFFTGVIRTMARIKERYPEEYRNIVEKSLENEKKEV